jgi:excisionase family DNA binding protein
MTPGTPSSSPPGEINTYWAEQLVTEMRLLRQVFEGVASNRNDPREAPKFLTVREVAILLNLSRSRVYELCNERQMRSIKDGRSIRIPADEPSKWASQKLRQR